MDNKLKTPLILTIFLLFLSTGISAEAIHSSFPAQIDTNKRYVFYSHGFIVEGDNPKPVHPRWGVYDFPAVKQALKGKDYELIAYHREKASDPFKHVQMLANHARELLKKGVQASDIYFVGFSRGGGITALVSNELQNTEVNYVILAGCSGLIKSQKQAVLYGRVYSVREKSDKVGSCGFLLNRGGEVPFFQEIVINTGKEHGAFYQPLDAWLKPVLTFINK